MTGFRRIAVVGSAMLVLVARSSSPAWGALIPTSSTFYQATTVGNIIRQTGEFCGTGDSSTEYGLVAASLPGQCTCFGSVQQCAVNAQAEGSYGESAGELKATFSVVMDRDAEAISLFQSTYSFQHTIYFSVTERPTKVAVIVSGRGFSTGNGAWGWSVDVNGAYSTGLPIASWSGGSNGEEPDGPITYIAQSTDSLTPGNYRIGFWGNAIAAGKSALHGIESGNVHGNISLRFFDPCGDGVVNFDEQCDLGADTGGSDTCCVGCRFRIAGEVCRPAVDSCDVADKCDGKSARCPANEVAPSGHICREAPGVCDVAESCDGTSPFCPTDEFKPNTFKCRGVEEGATCDVPEMCSGFGPECPEDKTHRRGFTCRAKANSCDKKERCNGRSKMCPADKILDADHDGICDRVQLCGYPLGIDVDKDGVSDACDFCIGGTPIRGAALKLGHYSTGPGDDTLLLRGKFVLSRSAAIDPVTNGARIVISDQARVLHDLIIPPGAFDSTLGAGWHVRNGGRVLKYVSSPPLGGALSTLTITRSAERPEVIRIRAEAEGGSHLRRPSSLPLGALVILDRDGVCGATTFQDKEQACSFDGGDDVVTCR